jgi:hypothetical protein
VAGYKPPKRTAKRPCIFCQNWRLARRRDSSALCLAEIPAIPFRTAVFIYLLKLFPGDTSILSDFRKHLTRQIDKTFRLLSAEINKDWPATGAGNPKQTTEYQARTCHIFIGILVDSYGFTDERSVGNRCRTRCRI